MAANPLLEFQTKERPQLRFCGSISKDPSSSPQPTATHNETHLFATLVCQVVGCSAAMSTAGREEREERYAQGVAELMGCDLVELGDSDLVRWAAEVPRIAMFWGKHGKTPAVLP